MPTFTIPASAAELLSALSWLLFFGGVALVLVSWAGRVPQRFGWAGASITVTGAAMSWSQPPVQAVVLAAGAIVVLVQLVPRRRRARPWAAQRRRFDEPWDQEAALLRLCGGDRAAVERLIRFEIERNPKLSRAGAALAAATRLRHER